MAFLAPTFVEGPASASVFAQDLRPEDENKEISGIVGEGFIRENKNQNIALTGLKIRDPRNPITRDRLDKAYKALWATNRFNDVKILVEPDPAPAGTVKVIIRVQEYQIVETVEFRGFTVLATNQLKQNLRVAAGDSLNPYHLKQDRDYIREQYLSKGYHFSTVEDSTRIGTSGGVILTWTVTEGPMVSVDRILFSGNDSVDASDLQRFMITKENDRLFGLIPTGRQPFIERNLPEDIKRIKLYYQLEGWLDIGYGEHVFVQDLVFSEDKTSVVIQIHIDEGRRYMIRGLRFQFDGSGPRVFPEDEIRAWLLSKPGDFYTENNANKDRQKILEKYGERAYIQADVTPTTVVAMAARELDLVFTIKENDKIYVGRLVFEGNHKTREEILRREFTRTGFVPGEEFNQKKLQLAARRLQDRGWIDPGGLNIRTQEGDELKTRDVVLDLKEAQTGTVRFAAGYSSSFGILGILELTQRNFDLADLPSSFDDLVNGTGLAGGGQFLRIRLAPAVKRQTYTIDFKEPYVYGYDFGLGTRGYITSTIRESYDDRRIGGSVILDKRYEPLTLQAGFNAYQVRIDNVREGAPPAVREIEGLNTVYSLTPAIIWDTRDSIILPTEGARFAVSHEYAGQVLPGSFDFNKLSLETEGHVTLYETEGHLKHVLSSQFTFGWVHGARGQFSVPLIERFYAGGRESIRGFQFRGMGPHENGDPVGGEVYAFGTVEYSYPIFVEFLRGAFFWDIANLAPQMERLPHEKWRNTVGFGIRFLIPQLGNIPVKLDFGFPLTRERDDERQTVTFDIGALF